jgi:predicted DCC family thiol-disulfide oxidoreductase YuxK
MSADAPLVLFDGVCNLCNASVSFIIDHDPQSLFRFAALQSDAGRARLAAVGGPLPEGDPESIVLLDSGRVFTESTAALQIARHLSGPIRLTVVFLLIPRVIRDAVYRFIARHRYRWFGRTAACRVPTPEVRSRFL